MLLSASPVLAAGPPTTLSVLSLPEWWAAAGMPGFSADAHMGSGLPLPYLGLVAGGVAVRDGLVPCASPWPGIDEIRTPLAWYDSSAVVIGEDAGWRGFAASLVELRAIAVPQRAGKPRAAFTLINGSSGVDRTGLMLQRGTAEGWLRGGALSEQRDGTALLGRRGEHVWFLDLGTIRGAHTFSGSYAQSGAANTTRRDADFIDPAGFRPPWPGFEEAVRSESGALTWSAVHGERRIAVAVRRGHDHRESFESPTTSFLTVFSEREAQQNAIELEAVTGPSEQASGLRLELTQAQVERSADFLNSAVPRDDRQRTVWLAARAARHALGGALELQLGAGYASAASVRAERVQAAPSAVWRRQSGTRQWRLHAGRFVRPVWSDLGPGVQAFTQDSWVGGAEVSAGDRARHWIELGLLASETGQRALLQRWPVRDLSLRYGWVPEPVRVQDAQVTLASGLQRGPFALDASGFARVRPLGGQTSQPDPAIGGRAGVEGGFRVFAGDLGVRLRLEGAWVGTRDNESLPEYFVQPRPLSGYATFAGSLAVTLGDARLVLRAENLEDQPHPQVWSDLSRPFPGAVAVGSGRQLRLELAWPFFN